MRAISSLLAFALLTPLMDAEDWPQWRGPMRDGTWREDGILENFPADGVMIAWRVSCDFPD